MQEIRGPCIAVKDVGLLSFEQTISQGCGRAIGDQSTLPPMADIYVQGSEAYHIDFGDIYSTPFPLWGQQIYPDDNPKKAWQNKTAFMIIDGEYESGVDPDTGETRVRGARDIKARFHIPVADEHVRKDFKLEYGMSFENTNSGVPLELCVGQGCTNGFNPEIYFNGEPL